MKASLLLALPALCRLVLFFSLAVVFLPPSFLTAAPSSPAAVKKKPALKPLYILGKSAKDILIEHSKSFLAEGQRQKKEEKTRLVITAEEDKKIVVKTPPRKIHVILPSFEKIVLKGLKKADVFLSAQKGEVSIEQSRGAFRVSLEEGLLKIKNSSGSIEARLYSAESSLSGFKGSVFIYSHLSGVALKESEGKFKILSYASPVYLEKLKGSLDFNVEKSDIRLKLFEGDVKGYSSQGSVTGSLTPKKVKIETGSGLIRLYFQASKARVEAQSWEGKVYAPRNFYKDRAGGVYKAKGSIKDRGPAAGQVSLKSQSGKIYIL